MSHPEIIIGILILLTFSGVIGYAIKILSKPLDKKPKITGRGGDFHE